MAASLQAANARADALLFNGEQAARDLLIAASLREREQETRTIQIEEEQAGLKVDLANFDRQRRRFESTQVAVAGSSGLEISGSAVEVIADSARELEFERESIQVGSERRQRQIRDEGALLGFEAERLRESALLTREIAGFQARSARSAGNLRAFQALLGGGGNLITGLA